MLPQDYSPMVEYLQMRAAFDAMNELAGAYDEVPEPSRQGIRHREPARRARSRWASLTRLLPGWSEA